MRIISSRMPWLILACSCLAMAISSADDAKPKKETVKVEKGRMVSSVTVKGTVEGENHTELSVRLKSWTNPLIVEHAVEHGAFVKKDHVLLKLELDKIQEQVLVGRENRESSALAIRLAEHELPILKQQLPLDLQAAERQKKQTGEDLLRFLQVDKAHEIESAEVMLKNAEFQVESSREELVQLEKMYRDKDLTEETELMILKRYKFMLANSIFNLGSTKLQTEQNLKILLPRREEDSKLAAAKAELTWEKTREELPLNVRQKELALEKMRHEDRRAKEKQAELEQDLRGMALGAPADGLLYYGRYVRGQWSGPAPTSYLKGGTLPANEVVMTIISRGKPLLHADVDEKEIAELKTGQPARIALTISPQRKLNGKVHRVVPVPQGGKYEVLIAVTDDVPEALVPGMTGSAKIITSQNDAALSVPSTAVFEDADTESFYVYLPGDTPQKKVVKTGLVTGGKTEILEGLKEGDEILAAKP